MIDRTCPYCGGHGKVRVAEAPRTCPECAGTGMQPIPTQPIPKVPPAPDPLPVILPVTPTRPRYRKPRPWVDPFDPYELRPYAPPLPRWPTYWCGPGPERRLLGEA